LGNPVTPGTIGISGTNASWAQLQVASQPILFSPFIALIFNF